MLVFGFDWFFGGPYEEQCDEARHRCAMSHFPEVTEEQWESHEDLQKFISELETKTLVYLRDGFSYEVRQFARLTTHGYLSFECEPVDEHYKVGSFVVSVPFEEIARIEVFAVHPDEKPSDAPQITGFRGVHQNAEVRP